MDDPPQKTGDLFGRPCMKLNLLAVIPQPLLWLVDAS